MFKQHQLLLTVRLLYFKINHSAPLPPLLSINESIPSYRSCSKSNCLEYIRYVLDPIPNIRTVLKRRHSW
jgi:hypothetical protein